MKCAGKPTGGSRRVGGDCIFPTRFFEKAAINFFPVVCIDEIIKSYRHKWCIMENDLNLTKVEKILKSADFSKETDLKKELKAKLGAVRSTNLEELMKEEGIYLMSSHEKKRQTSPGRSMTDGKDREKEALERNNPYKKKLPPFM